MSRTTPPVNPTQEHEEKPLPFWSDSRFWIAALLIMGMLAILGVTVYEQQFSQTPTLAAIFSGWITSIVAFYFYGQSTAQAQNQIKTSTRAEEKAKQRVSAYEKTLRDIRTLAGVPDTVAKIGLKTTLPPQALLYTDSLDQIKKIIDEL
jgi:uncharacterized membrane protein